jgi:hypothetical protein
MTVAVISGGIVHDVSRHWRRHIRVDRTPMQIARTAQQPTVIEKSGHEDSEAIELIDLTVLQKQTTEPPVVGFDVPAGLPPVVNATAVPLVQTSEPDVADFKPYSADGPEPMAAPKSGFVSFWRRMAEKVWGNTFADGSEECEQLQSMPRQVQPAGHWYEVCPYDGSQYRKSNKPAMTGEEEQAAPKTAPGNLIPKPSELHKQPKLDTMEIRPGDLPWSWARRPF